MRNAAGTVELRECPRCGAYVDPREGCRCGMRAQRGAPRQLLTDRSAPAKQIVRRVNDC